MACLIFLGLTGFQIEPSHAQSEDNSHILPYDLSQATATFSLPKKLAEISALATISPTELIAVQDEKGIIFTLSTVTGKITKEFKFAKKGDFEGIEVMDGHIFVLRSDGVLFMIDSLNGEETESAELFKTSLTRRCDAEGLVKDVAFDRLLILCKERDLLGPKNAKSIFSFDVRSKKLSERPFIVYDNDDISKLIGGGKSRLQRFKPSAIAIHPLDNTLYILSSADRRLVVSDRSGNLLLEHQFEKNTLRQPEGITFSTNGDLYIASEAGGKKAVLAFYKHR